MLIPIWLSTTIVYIVTGLQSDFSHWIVCELIFSFLGTSGLLIGIVTGIAIKNQNLAIQAASLVTIPFVLYGGLVVNLKNLPAYSSWLQYFTPMRYSFNAFVNSQLRSDALDHLGDIDLVRDRLGLTGTVAENII